MSECVRAGCRGQALAPWWQLCPDCTQPLLERADDDTGSSADQRATAGWEAVDWAERIAPGRWGHAVEIDPWVMTVRCLVFASVATSRAAGCWHTNSPSPRPVVAVASALDTLACPSCAETVVAQHTVDGGCDRCRLEPVGPSSRVALIGGASLIIVGQLCTSCTSAALELLAWAATPDE